MITIFNFILIMVFSFIGEGCENSINKYYDSIYIAEIYTNSGYHLNAPDTILFLPSSLNEISGLSLVDDTHLVAIQDEKGEMYVVNLKNGIVEHELKFWKNGDYEGIELAGDEIFIAQSNGDLFRFRYNLSKSEVESEKIKTPLKSRNNVEGLAFDHENNRLLIACKGKGDINDNEVKGKAIYAIDIKTLEFKEDPVYSFKKKDISDIIKNKYPDMKLGDNVDPSGIAIHPVSGNIYILSHAGKALIVFDKKGEIIEFYPLNPSLFQQPEGICFGSNGDLYISNEIGHNRPNILKFNYQK